MEGMEREDSVRKYDTRTFTNVPKSLTDSLQCPATLQEWQIAGRVSSELCFGVCFDMDENTSLNKNLSP